MYNPTTVYLDPTTRQAVPFAYTGTDGAPPPPPPNSATSTTVSTLPHEGSIVYVLQPAYSTGMPGNVSGSNSTVDFSNSQQSFSHAAQAKVPGMAANIHASSLALVDANTQPTPQRSFFEASSAGSHSAFSSFPGIQPSSPQLPNSPPHATTQQIQYLPPSYPQTATAQPTQQQQQQPSQQVFFVAEQPIQSMQLQPQGAQFFSYPSAPTLQATASMSEVARVQAATTAHVISPLHLPNSPPPHSTSPFHYVTLERQNPIVTYPASPMQSSYVTMTPTAWATAAATAPPLPPITSNSAAAAASTSVSAAGAPPSVASAVAVPQSPMSSSAFLSHEGPALTSPHLSGTTSSFTAATILPATGMDTPAGLSTSTTSPLQGALRAKTMRQRGTRPCVRSFLTNSPVGCLIVPNSPLILTTPAMALPCPRWGKLPTIKVG